MQRSEGIIHKESNSLFNFVSEVVRFIVVHENI